ncbi:hypothetical protein G6F50_017968 [Rhizopus delemar]|uniref:Uncharacterized protein n=1 Tax=Rhizopus delemar TaxID=936053 RepID=A0A9P6XNR3_9FUNG|nr:hypothetical protein G6F50_017968 [Rhizopus delemar]
MAAVATWSSVPATSTVIRKSWPAKPVATSWTSSPTPRAPPTGVPTTTLPNPSSSRWPRNPARSRSGSCAAPVPVAPQRR